ncbi:MAG: hypothetical protein WDN23_09820 [Edaphobacter sp.]
MRRFFAAWLLGLVCGSAGAQENNRPRAFDAIRSSDSYRQAVLGAYQEYESSLSTHCQKIDINMNTSEAKVYGTIQTDAGGNIVNGHWKEMTDGVACGEKRSYAASVTIQNGKTAVFSLFPGKSAAGPVLQHDAVQYAAVGAGAGSCPVDVLETSLPNGEPSGPGVAWDEKWVVRACGKKSVVTMHFAPDATGTTVSVSPKETVAAP